MHPACPNATSNSHRANPHMNPTSPNKPEPTAVGAVRSVPQCGTVHVASRRWLLSLAACAMMPKLPTWFRITSAVLALPFLALFPLGLIFAVMTFTHSGPGGHSTYPYTVTEIAIGLAWLIIPLFYGVFFVWLAMGAPASLRKRKPKIYSVCDEYSGPRCVSCREPISPKAETCPKCGWTQPR
jgi:hypothetical protein